MSGRIGRASRRGIATVVALLACSAVLAPSAFALPPANDPFAASQLVTGASVTANGTNVEATKEPGEPNHAGYTGGKSVWYRWIAPADGVAVVDTFGSSFDTVLAVYTGTTVDGLHLVAGNDQYNGNQSRVRISVTGGQEYRIAVDGYYGSQGSVTLHVTASSAPANDNLANAAPLTGSAATATGSNAAATHEPGEPNHAYAYGQASVWWTWTAPSTGGVTLSTAGSGFDTALAVYTGDTVSGLIPVADNDNAGTGYQSSLSFRAIAGATYRIAVDSGYNAYYGYGEGGEGSISLSLSLSPPPANDAFAAAADLGDDATAAATGHNVGAGTEPGEPSHYSYSQATNSVWYTWKAPSDGSLTLTSSASFSRALAVYTGTQVSSLTRIPLQAQDCNCQPGQIRVRVEAGVTYRIALDGLGPSQAGTFNLSLELIASPANDDFADAQLLVGTSATVDGTNVGATQEPGEPIHEDNYYDPSVWYTWTAPATTGVTLDTAGSALNGVVAIYTGTSVGALTRVVSTPANGTTREKRYFRAAAGQTYRIAIDGRGAQMGTFTLSLSTTAVPANDMFAAASVVTGTDTTVTGNTVGATGEHASEPGYGGTAGATVWYRWTAPSNGRVQLSLPTRDAWLTVGAYTGTSVDSLTEVAYPSDATTFRAEAGTTYRFLVTGGTRPWRGHFSMRVVLSPPPANDDFADATLLTGASTAGSGSNVSATKESGEPTHCCGYGEQSVWWRWTAPADGRVTVDLSSSTFDWVAAVYTGSTLSGLTAVAGADYGNLVFNATKGTTYRIAVDGWSTYSYASGSIAFTLNLVDAPPNDLFADATVLQGSSDDVTGTNVNSSREIYEPGHAGLWNERSVWYRWRAPASGTVTLDTAGSGFDTVLAVYTGSSVDWLSTVASSEDFAGSPQARVTFEASRGTVYRIAVDGESNATGAVKLSLRQGTPPANDAFASATDAGSLPAQLDGDSSFATKQAGEPDHADDEGGASVWWKWTAPADGALHASTGGSEFDTVLGIYTGDAVGSLTEVGATTASDLIVDVVGGTTYAIAVDGANDRSGPLQGAIALGLEFEEGATAPLVADPPDEGTGGDGGEGGGTGGDTTGGDPPGGGDTTGGDTGTGGDTTGGDPPIGGDTGGDSTGGDPGTGGDTTGGDPPGGGDTTGGDTTGGADDTSGDPPGGDETGGDEQTGGGSAGETSGVPAERAAAPTAPVPPPPARSAAPLTAPTSPFAVTLTVPAQKIGAVLRRGLTGTAACSAACRLDVAVVLPGAGVRAKARMAAAQRSAASATTAGAPARFTVKLSAAARKALRKARAMTVEVVVVARQGTQSATTKRRVTLRR